VFDVRDFIATHAREILEMSTYKMLRRWMLDLWRLSGYSLLVTSVISGTMMAVLRAPWRVIVANVAVIYMFTVIISGLSMAVMPTLGRRTEQKPLLFRWCILTAALLAMGTIGTTIASVIGQYGFGLDRSMPHLFVQSLTVALPITVIVGVLTAVIQAGRGRLEASQLALQTQRLERARAERLAAEAKLASLSSRVQPHFLFNTLNSISALVRQNPVEAEQTIERLASLLRSSLDEAETVPIEQELKLVADYLEIQHTRFGSRLRYQLSSPPDGVSTVPPFAVQTVVENSIKHVAGHRQEGVAVSVHAVRSGSDLLVDVTDDGPGFGEDAMRDGHGLDNLQGRLRAVYGERAGLEFLRSASGMTVRLRIPGRSA
jgi:two-component system, LytTR family, sensor histidine kinase AlgZ